MGLNRPAENYEHDTAPDSRLVESTSRSTFLRPAALSAPPATRSASVRTNRDGSYINPTDPETDYQKLAADVTYTPGEKWTVNFRYRMLNLDSDGPKNQTFNLQLRRFRSNRKVPVRQSIDIDRNNYAATVSYRPSRRLTFKGDYEREDTDRNHTGIRPSSVHLQVNPTHTGTYRATKRSTGSD